MQVVVLPISASILESSHGFVINTQATPKAHTVQRAHVGRLLTLMLMPA